MSNRPDNEGKEWSDEDVKILRQLAEEGSPKHIVALKLRRTEHEVESKASDLDISLKS